MDLLINMDSSKLLQYFVDEFDLMLMGWEFTVLKPSSTPSRVYWQVSFLPAGSFAVYSLLLVCLTQEVPVYLAMWFVGNGYNYWEHFEQCGTLWSKEQYTERPHRSCTLLWCLSSSPSILSSRHTSTYRMVHLVASVVIGRSIGGSKSRGWRIPYSSSALSLPIFFFFSLSLIWLVSSCHQGICRWPGSWHLPNSASLISCTIW